MDNTKEAPTDEVKNNLLSFTGKIHLICNNKELAEALPGLSSAKILGFDTETRPSFIKGQVFKVALLQLSTANDAYLVRIHKVTQFDGIVKIFENPEVVKTGVAIRDDIKILQKVFKFKPQGFIELQDVAKQKGLKNFGLKGMSEEILKGSISKGPKITNWELPVLNDRQQTYAATDAWIGLKLYQELVD